MAILKVFLLGLTLLASIPLATAAEEAFTGDNAEPEILTKRSLLTQVWPGMTIEQAVQILGEPAETLELYQADKKTAPAVRYATFWLLPAPEGGLHIQCIVLQRGFKTQEGQASQCTRISGKFKIAEQQ